MKHKMFILSKTLTGIEIMISVIFLSLSLVLSYLDTYHYGAFLGIVFIVILSLEFYGIKLKKYGIIFFSCVFRCFRVFVVFGLLIYLYGIEGYVFLNVLAVKNVFKNQLWFYRHAPTPSSDCYFDMAVLGALILDLIFNLFKASLQINILQMIHKEGDGLMIVHGC